jgi:hypothetical protein
MPSVPQVWDSPRDTDSLFLVQTNEIKDLGLDRQWDKKPKHEGHQ